LVRPSEKIPTEMQLQQQQSLGQGTNNARQGRGSETETQDMQNLAGYDPVKQAGYKQRHPQGQI
jgi:hypothetical protein